MSLSASVIKTKQVPHELLEPAQSWLDRGAWTHGWPSDKSVPFGHWNLDITNSGHLNTIDVVQLLPEVFKPIWEFLRPKDPQGNNLENTTLIRSYANKHTYGTEGYRHVDTTRPSDHTCVIYLNKKWEAQWGGETTFYNTSKTEIINAVLPKYGRAITFPGTVPHCARALSRICPEVRTTLMFKFAIDLKAMYPVEDVLKGFITDLGAFQKPHKNGSLADHLLRVYGLMKSAGANDTLAIAGGLHSIYGTSAYQNACLPLDSKDVENVFGPEVDRLVRLFCKLKRPADLAPNRDDKCTPLSEEDLLFMRCIEAANLYDQGEIDRNPHLKAFVEKVRRGENIIDGA